MTYIYILKLRFGKFYIGKTDRPDFRINSHFNGDGSVWTRKYQPVNVEKIIPNCDDLEEDFWTIRYMKEKGINNVRGGSFCSIKLSNEDKTIIKRMIRGASNQCFICGSSNHFANKCDDDEYEIMEFLKEENRCFRCHRKGHWEEDCYAKTYSNGTKLDDSETESENGSDETESECESEYTSNSNSESDEMEISSQKDRCYRCHRKGHWTNTCYAKTYSNGKRIYD